MTQSGHSLRNIGSANKWKACRPVLFGTLSAPDAHYFELCGYEGLDLSVYRLHHFKGIRKQLHPRAAERRKTNMTNNKHDLDMKPIPGTVYGFAGGMALLVALAAFAVPRPAGALPAYAQQTKLACGRCHVNPAGGGERTAFGKAFAANGHKLASAAKPGKANVSDGASSSPPAAAAPPIVYDYARAQSWSLDPPYYSLFLR